MQSSAHIGRQHQRELLLVVEVEMVLRRAASFLINLLHFLQWESCWARAFCSAPFLQTPPTWLPVVRRSCSSNLYFSMFLEGVWLRPLAGLVAQVGGVVCTYSLININPTSLADFKQTPGGVAKLARHCAALTD